MSVSSYVDCEESRDSEEHYYTNFRFSTVLFLELIRQCFNWTSSLSALRTIREFLSLVSDVIPRMTSHNLHTLRIASASSASCICRDVYVCPLMSLHML